MRRNRDKLWQNAAQAQETNATKPDCLFAGSLKRGSNDFMTNGTRALGEEEGDRIGKIVLTVGE
jgi:monomeric isocitrate dehydrogenase